MALSRAITEFGALRLSVPEFYQQAFKASVSDKYIYIYIEREIPSLAVLQLSVLKYYYPDIQDVLQKSLILDVSICLLPYANIYSSASHNHTNDMCLCN